MTRQQIIDLIRYIRLAEEEFDRKPGGKCRSYKEIETDGDMPKEYFYLIDVVGQID